MPHDQKIHRAKLAGLAVLMLGLASPVAAQAQAAPDLANQLLIAILVKRGVITKADASAIMQQVVAEQAQAAAAPAPPPAPEESTTVSSNTTPDGTIHVTYIPKIVRDQITERVKEEVLAEQQADGDTAAVRVPGWVQHVKIYGDIRTRYESDMFPSGNDDTGAFPNFNAINTGAPYDTSAANPNFPPQLNANRGRNRFRIRARLGVAVDLGNGFTAGFRLATGESNSPVSENQSLGAANNGQGGNFSKYAIWLDRAFIAYTPPLGENADLTVEAGRFDNPFFSTNLIWADDLGFDGIAATGDYRFDNGLEPFFTAGAFPVFNTDFNYASNQPDKFPSHDKYMFAAQLGTSYKFNDDYEVKIGLADYLFTNVEGKLSAPCTVLSAADSCSTDDDRPAFAQNGNTYMALRDIIPTVANGNGTTAQYQYFGLASKFNELALTGEVDFSNFDPTHIWVNGEYVKNLAFSKSDVASKAVNNRAAAPANTLGAFAGGDTGYFAYASVGQKILFNRWDWNATLGYKYVESDAVIDGFNDSDFGFGGTNLKGYILGGQVALTHNVWVRLRYLSADSIAGPPYNSDVAQFDLNAKF